MKYDKTPISVGDLVYVDNKAAQWGRVIGERREKYEGPYSGETRILTVLRPYGKSQVMECDINEWYVTQLDDLIALRQSEIDKYKRFKTLAAELK
jgi:hypothetical protein